MTRSLADLFPDAPLTVQFIREQATQYGRDRAAMWLGECVAGMELRCVEWPKVQVEGTTDPAVSTGSRSQAQVQVQERML